MYYFQFDYGNTELDAEIELDDRERKRIFFGISLYDLL